MKGYFLTVVDFPQSLSLKLDLIDSMRRALRHIAFL
jgi:hypothetical protein